MPCWSLSVCRQLYFSVDILVSLSIALTTEVSSGINFFTTVRKEFHLVYYYKNIFCHKAQRLALGLSSCVLKQWQKFWKSVFGGRLKNAFEALWKIFNRHNSLEYETRALASFHANIFCLKMPVVRIMKKPENTKINRKLRFLEFINFFLSF